MSVPAFQDFATIANHAESMCVVTFRPLRDDFVWNTRAGTSVPLEQSSVPAFQKNVVVEGLVDRPCLADNLVGQHLDRGRFVTVGKLDNALVEYPHAQLAVCR